MRKLFSVPAFVMLILTVAFPPAFSVENGAPDGNTHPAVGSLIASIGSSFCSLNNQRDPECSAVLIAPDLLITAAECGIILRDAFTAGSIDRMWVDFDPNSNLDCAGFVPVDPNQAFIDPAFDPAREDAANVAVLRLAVQVQTMPVTLPVAGRLKALPESQPYTVVAYGGLNPQTQELLTDILRRSATASFQGLSSEILTLHLETGPGSDHPCMEYSNRGGAAFVDGTNENVALVIPSNEGLGCTSQSRYQRLDVPSVRTFLTNFMTLP